MNYCSECGYQIEENAPSCAQCGSRAHRPSLDAPSKPTLVASDVPQLENAPPVDGITPRRKRNNVKRVLDGIIAVGLLILLCLAVVVYIVVRPPADPDGLRTVRSQPSHPNNAMYYLRSYMRAQLEREGFKDIRFCYMRDAEIKKPGAYTYLINSCFSYRNEDGSIPIIIFLPSGTINC